MIELKGDATTFIWSSTPKSPLKSSVDLKVKVPPSELLWLAEKLGCSTKGSRIIVSNLDIYNRLLVYACVRPLIKNIENVKDLTALVLELNNWDALYWASRFRELWWKHGNYKSLLKTAKAFKLFFGLDGGPIYHGT
jgi:hypothetical protein